MIYVPSHVYEIEQTLVVKTRAPLSTIGPAIKQAVEALGPGRPVFDIRPMDDIVEASIDTTRFTMLVLSGFAVASLVLAGVGLYGTLAYLTSQRTQEFGVRLALGASAASILRLVIREGCVLTGLGAALGLAGAIAATARAARSCCTASRRSMASPSRASSRSLRAVALVAVGWPAWRAARVDPATALRARVGRSSSLRAFLRTQFIQQRPGILQIRRVKALGEPPVNLRQHLPRLLVLALPLPQARQARGGAQFPRFRAVAAGRCRWPVR